MQIPVIGRIIAWSVSFQKTTDFVHSNESLSNEHDRHVAAPADSPGIGSETLFLDSIPQDPRNNVAPELVETSVDIRALNRRELLPEHDVDATIASLSTLR